MSNSKTKMIISAVFSFILFLSITCGVLSAGAAITVLNEGYLKKCTEDSMYAEKNFNALQDLLADEAAEHGMPEDLLKKQLDRSVFTSDLEKNITAGLSGSDPDGASVDRFRTSVKDALDSYLKKNKVGANSNIEMTVEEIVRDSAGYYSVYTDLLFAGYYAEYRAMFVDFVKFAIPVCLGAALVLIIVIIRLQQEAVNRKIYICSSLFASGIAISEAGHLFGRGMDVTFPKSLAGYDAFIDGFFGSAAYVFWGCGAAAVILAIVILAIGRGRN